MCPEILVALVANLECLWNLEWFTSSGRYAWSRSACTSPQSSQIRNVRLQISQQLIDDLLHLLIRIVFSAGFNRIHAFEMRLL
jgi:hypothetical protein